MLLCGLGLGSVTRLAGVREERISAVTEALLPLCSSAASPVCLPFVQEFL